MSMLGFQRIKYDYTIKAVMSSFSLRLYRVLFVPILCFVTAFFFFLFFFSSQQAYQPGFSVIAAEGILDMR